MFNIKFRHVQNNLSVNKKKYSKKFRTMFLYQTNALWNEMALYTLRIRLNRNIKWCCGSWVWAWHFKLHLHLRPNTINNHLVPENKEIENNPSPQKTKRTFKEITPHILLFRGNWMLKIFDKLTVLEIRNVGIKYYIAMHNNISCG